MSSYKACKRCLERPTGFGVKWAKAGSDFCNLHGGQLPEVEERAKAVVEAARARLASETPLGYDGVMETLKTPSQWEAEHGTYVVNRGVYQDEATPISEETFLEIIRPLTRALALPKAPRTVSQALAVERIETKIEEFKEASYTMPSRQWTDKEWEDYRFAQGHLSGLQQALDILKDL